MSAQRNREGPCALHPDDPGHQGENYGLGSRQTNAAFAKALKRAGHITVAPDDVSTQARNHLLAVLAQQGRG